MKVSYEFDPCALDGSDKEITLDKWQPIQKKDNGTIVMSKWRSEQNGDCHTIQPSLDDLRKIKVFLKKRKSDSEIMRAFGITCETLVAIKKDKYCPVEGITLDNQSKIYKGFEELRRDADKLRSALLWIADNIIHHKKANKEFRKLVGARAIKKKMYPEEED